MMIKRPDLNLKRTTSFGHALYTEQLHPITVKPINKELLIQNELLKCSENTWKSDYCSPKFSDCCNYSFLNPKEYLK